jgi:hypothetical protein
MIDVLNSNEPSNNTRFYEIPANSHEDQIGCVDGRGVKAEGLKKWVKMLGGSLHQVYLEVIANDKDLDAEAVSKTFGALKANNRKIGVHWGSHQKPDENVSDCGAGDRIADILQTIRDNEQIIKERMLTLVSGLKSANSDGYNRLLQIAGVEQDIQMTDLKTAIEAVIGKLCAYNPEKIKIKGAQLIKAGIDNGAEVMHLVKDHGENRALVNLKEGVTFDTTLACERNDQAFDLDLAEAVQQAEEIGVNRSFATLASLALYIATEMVLVEQKGKEALPVYFYN